MTDQTPSAASPAGLSDNAAGALAYVTIIPAIVFLLVEPYNRKPYVRFHAWQCIFLAIAWVGLDVVIDVLAHVAPFMALAALALYPLVALLMLILWVVLLIKAANGQKLKLPIIGDLAEKQAGA